MIFLDTPIKNLSGVGKSREAQLKKLGIITVKDLLFHFPRAYERRGHLTSIVNCEHEATASLILTVGTEVKNSRIKNRMTISKLRAFDGSGSCEVVFFNSPFVKDIFHIGAQFRFYGKVLITRSGVQIVNPKYEPIIDTSPLPDLIPVYSLTEGISSKFLEKLIKGIFDTAISQISDPLPDEIQITNRLCALSYALRNIHFPENEEALTKALKRLAFDEMFNFGVGIALSARYKTAAKGIRFSQCDLTPITSLLPYELTSGQKNAINDIYRDTVIGNTASNSVSPMARILVGDVGSGKTICAVIAMYIAVKSGYQATIMAPTEILAKQHYNDIAALLKNFGIKVSLLVGSMTVKQKENTKLAMKNGDTDIIIGTHALISENVEFAKLGLVVTDEQHRFGVAQRANLQKKGVAAHLLVMSATPIPRSLALALYGDLDISRINEMPKGRMKVDTFVVDETYRTRLNSFIDKQIENGGQCYIVCPAIEKNEADDENTVLPTSISELSSIKQSNFNIKNVVDYTEKLRQSFPHLNIECLHGKTNATDKEKIMASFANGKTDVLVATTVIEVGVNVPNASLMIIENAERFGLSQLHQLRGRVGRGTRKSYCVLVSDSNSQKSLARLNVMKNTYNGYDIAEKDLILRGPGDFFAKQNTGMRQSGGFEFKIASLCNDGELFAKAFAAAKQVINEDPTLSLPKNFLLKETLKDFTNAMSMTIS